MPSIVGGDIRINHLIEAGNLSRSTERQRGARFGSPHGVIQWTVFVDMDTEFVQVDPDNPDPNQTSDVVTDVDVVTRRS